MTVATTQRVVRYLGNGATTVFAFDFPVLEESDLEVFLYDETTKVATFVPATGYQMTGAGDENGGEISISPAPTSNQTIILKRATDLLQNLDIMNQGGFYPELLEDAIDKVTLQVQDLNEEVSRTIRMLPGESFAKLLGMKEDLSARVLAFDNQGEPITLGLNEVGSGGESADQFLNTTDSVQFAGLYIPTPGFFGIGQSTPDVAGATGLDLQQIKILADDIDFENALHNHTMHLVRNITARYVRTRQTETGDGVTTIFPITLQWSGNENKLEVTLDGVVTTAWTYSDSPSDRITFDAAPASNVEIKIGELMNQLTGTIRVETFSTNTDSKQKGIFNTYTHKGNMTAPGAESGNATATSNRLVIEDNDPVDATMNGVDSWAYHGYNDYKGVKTGVDAPAQVLFEGAIHTIGPDDTTARNGLGKRVGYWALCKGSTSGLSPDFGNEGSMGVYVNHGDNSEAATGASKYGRWRRGVCVEDVRSYKEMVGKGITPHSMDYGIHVATTGEACIKIDRLDSFMFSAGELANLSGAQADYGLLIKDDYGIAAIEIPNDQKLVFGRGTASNAISISYAAGTDKIHFREAGVNLFAVDVAAKQIECAGPLELFSSAVVGIPLVANGNILYCTNGDAGSPCLAVRSGGTWLRVPLGAAISAT